MRTTMIENFDYLRANLDGPTLIEASAGTGKTYSLERLVARLVIEGGEEKKGLSIDRILVVTFMREAASELKMRVRKTLANYLVRWNEFTAGKAFTEDDDPLLKKWADSAKSPDERLAICEKLSKAIGQIDLASILTIHGFAQKLLTEFSVSCENFTPRKLIDDASLAELRTFALDEFLREKLPKDNPELLSEILSYKNFAAGFDGLSRETKEARNTLAITEFGKEKLLSPDATQWFRDLYVEFSEVFAKVKERQHLMTYDDLLLDLLSGLRKEKKKATSSETTFIDTIRKKYRAVLIDEFQDTDPLQYEIFHLLFLDPLSSKIPVVKNAFFVGDPKQSIYSFRNAELDTYFKAKKEVANTSSLSTNYRATKELVDIVNDFFSSSKAFLFEDKTVSFETHSVSSEAIPPLMFCEPGVDPVPIPAFEIWTALGTKEELKSRENRTIYDLEPKAIANDIAQLLNGNYFGRHGEVRVYWGTERERKIRPSDIAILVRQNSIGFEIGKELRRHNIRFCTGRKENIFQSAEALEILFTLRAILSTQNRDALKSAAATTLVGYSLQELSDERKVTQLQELFTNASEELDRLGIYAVFLRLMRETNPEKGFGTYARLLKDENNRAIINYEHVLELIDSAQLKNLSSSGLVAWLAEKIRTAQADTEGEEIRADNDPSLVNIVTIHKSKGLEYPVVYLAKAYTQKTDGSKSKKHLFRENDANGNRRLLITPNASIETNHSQTKQKIKEESVRSAYVAMTRASERLVLPLSFAITTTGKYSSYDKNPYLCAFNSKYESRDAMQKLLEVFESKTHSIDEVAEPFVAVKSKTLDEKDAIPALQDSEQRLERSWVRSSFTTLSKALVSFHQVGASPYLAFPAGTSAGTFLHKTMELAVKKAKTLPQSLLKGDEWMEKLADQLFDRNLKGTIPDLPEATPDPAVGINAASSAEGYCRLWMRRLFVRLLNTKLTGQETLQEVLLSRKIAPEIDFLASVSNTNFSLEELEKAFQGLGDFQFTLNREEGSEGYALKNFKQSLKGFLTGQIDLVFEDSEGLFWIVDWKSNKIEDPEGAHSRDYAGNYTQEAMETLMQGANYKLQALCYLVALKRYLKTRFETEEDAFSHMGGAVYVFLRGLGDPKENDTTGLYRMPMNSELRQAINQLDALFSSTKE